MKKRIVPALLALCMLLLTACSGGGGGSSTAEESSAASTESGSTVSESTDSEAETGDTGELPFGPDNPIELTAAVNQSPIQGDFNEIQILKDYAEESGIHITFQNVPASDVQTQLSLMLNSGELPDILMKMNVTSTDQARYSAEDLFVALSDYPQYMTNLQKWFDEYPTAEQAVTQQDGKIYAAPYILAGDAIRMGSKIWYNSDVLEKLSMEMPTTTDEFYDYLVAAKGLDYNGNGQADEIPLTASSIDEITQTLMGSFGLMNRGSSHVNVFVDDSDNLQYAYTSEQYREELRYVNKLYTEGLIDQDIFTMDYAQEIAKCSTGRGLTFIMVNNSPVSNTEYEDYSFGFTEPLEGPNGDKTFGNYSLPASDAGQFMITYTCEEKGEDAIIAAMTYMDHWYSDEGIISYFMGIKDVTYEEDPDSPGGLALTDAVLNDPDGRTFEQVLAEYVPWAGGANPSVATNEYFKGGETWPVCLTAVEGLVNYIPEEVWAPFTRYYTTDEATTMSSLKTDLDTYHQEWRAYFITGERSLDDNWDEYVSGTDGVGLSEYMEIYQKGYEAYQAEQAE
ncbi:MAG: extracellular solute-binding protein [Acutalibacter sp.]|jgi:putative aldouronate transport system substrate-binding protein